MPGRNAARLNILSAEALAPVPVARPFLPGADALLPYLRRIDESRWYSNFGPLLTDFENKLCARFPGSTHVVTCANATQGLTLTLQAMQLPPGSLCAMPAFTFVASAHAVVAAGLTPYFLDVDLKDWMLKPDTVHRALANGSQPISVVMPVSPFGALPDIEAWLSFRRSTGVPVLLDAAAAFDTVRRAPLPLVVSLHATKVLGIGEGGFLATEDADLAVRVRQLTTFGFRGSRQSDFVATNAKLSEYAAAVGLAAMDRWPQDRLRYARTAQFVRAAMTSMPDVEFQDGWGVDWVTSVCNVKLPAGSADAVETLLNEAGVGTRRWWGAGCAGSPAFAPYPQEDLQNTALLSDSILGLPFSIDLDIDQITRVSKALNYAISSL